MSSVQRRAERPLGRVAVLGLGVMGGSLARAVSALELAERVTGWSPRSTERDAALTARAVSLAAAEWPEAVAEADVVILAVPLDVATHMLPEVAAATGADTTLSDVSSLKAPLERAARAAGVADRWVGAHPMAGSEASGFWASRADLYEGARVWVVPGEARSPHADRVDRLWRALGGHTHPISAEAHDRLMTMVSHLPQMVSNALAATLDDHGVDPALLGPGGRDMTRLAGSDSTMWLHVLRHAPGGLSDALRAVGAEAERIARWIDEGDLGSIDRLMRRTRGWRGRR